MAAKPNPEREWKKAVDAHAAHTMHGILTHCCDLIANSRAGPLLGGLPTVEIQGPDGEWRRYYVRLTEAAQHAPLDPAHLGRMTLPSVRPAPPEPNQHGYVSSYVSPHGHLSGLRGRLANWLQRVGTDRALPWAGLGFAKDLEVTLQLLNLQEFAEWLRVNGPPEHRQFADDILSDQFTLEAVRDACDTAGQRNEPDPVKAVENLQAELETYDAMRRVLVETGALADDDHDTPLPDLLRALLS